MAKSTQSLAVFPFLNTPHTNSLSARHIFAGKISAEERARASAMEAATCDRFGNPVLRQGVETGVGRALAAQEDFTQLPAFARFRERAASFQKEDQAEASTVSRGAHLLAFSM